MPYPQRRSPRLQGFDYSQAGTYFVTICTFQRVALFGSVVNDKMQLNLIGEIAQRLWQEIPNHFSNVELDGFVVMPNHVHGIVVIVEGEESRTRHASSLQNNVPIRGRANGTKAGALGAILGSYKAAVTKEVNKLMGLTAPRIWQSRYHDHIIRTETDLKRIREYVDTNPALWEQDTFFRV